MFATGITVEEHVPCTCVCVIAYIHVVSATSDSTICSVCMHPVQVEEWYAKRETQGLGVKEKGKKRAVYLATDDSHLIMEAQRK